ncbi:DUF4258 domain-containing protein [Tenacibaculum sp. IB213877]|uniref:DUF4258 domain-containing protein n=1 Tax=Tenacibaculum sp. IB213877 TaxID=3097351 RepID=UPI002A5B0A1B|nr:DUF4258 domain-containing protein [Tenacibaculum sp. IB213877]MDY0779605.1 DUF4258 domain-containing protein [Tenacibaculum sp. IB213877]
MQLLKRFGYYLLGVAIGVPVVLFFWKKKDVSFDYGMDARTLKTIRIRERIYSENAKETMTLHSIDTAQISKILQNGDVNFGKSKPRQKPCAEYYISGKNIDLYVVRCDSTSTIDKVFVK